jgi:LAO/AO transport system kinase
MCDLYTVLQLPNAGDDLQAIKKGVMELADLIVVNKADLDSDAARRAAAQISGTLRIFGRHGEAGVKGQARVLQLSALKSAGIDTFWSAVEDDVRRRRADGSFDARRRRQALDWMWDMVHASLQTRFRQAPAVRNALPAILHDVAAAKMAPSAAAHALLAAYDSRTS